MCNTKEPVVVDICYDVFDLRSSTSFPESVVENSFYNLKFSIVFLYYSLMYLYSVNKDCCCCYYMDQIETNGRKKLKTFTVQIFFPGFILSSRAWLL